MAKYLPTDIPPGETKRIQDMTADEYRSWRGRCGGRSTSKRKLRSQRRAARAKKPGLKMFHALVKRIAHDNLDSVAHVSALGTPEYPINHWKALKLLNAARAFRKRNPL